ncbi:MAG: hypothetical protein QGG63_02075 [Candidatus Pacebacteria bacterium]|jgi:TRAP-type C4-dicarboxylate transport system permease small subunit|nr:hypothetical protein [Candidatus Paceibacterota bacterium]|tara:strand:+ start:579 stop:833 length:255 start_codon:yes stop_codon:yes gene_type:complete
MSSVTELVSKIESHIIQPLIGILFALALLFFFWGGAQFILNAGNEEKRTTGKSHMLWGIIGMLIIFGVYGILRILGGTFGFSTP